MRETERRQERLAQTENKEVWHNAAKLESFGFPAAKYLLANGELDEERYLAESFQLVKDEATGKYYIGELEIPAELAEGDFGEEIIGGDIMDCGLGHRRVMNNIKDPAKVLRMAMRTVDMAAVNGDKKSWWKQVMMAVKERYVQESHQEGRRRGAVVDVAKLGKSEANWLINFVLDGWKRVDPEGYHNMMMGKPNDKWHPEKVDKWLTHLSRWLDKGFGKELRDNGITRRMIFHPAAVAIDMDVPTVLVGTDLVLDPRGWNSKHPKLVAYQINVERYREILGEEAAARLVCLDGFPTQLAALARKQYLIDRRAEEISKPDGLPLTIFMAASGAAKVQQEYFEEVMVELAPQVAVGKIHLVVQSGADEVGRQVYEDLEGLAEKLERQYPGFQDGLINHHSTVQGAVDFGKVISGGEAPLVVFTKGSEWTGMLMEAEIDHIAPVAIGDQEYWNIIIAAMKDARISIMPIAYEQVSKFIDTALAFPAGMKRSAHLAVDRHRVRNLGEALYLSAWAIAEKRTVAEVRGDATVRGLAWFMRQ